MTALTLYGTKLSPYVARVLLTVRAKGLDVTLAEPPGGLKSPQYLAINPFGKMPALVDGDASVIESEVICEYLEDRFPQNPILPGDALARARSRTVSRAVDLYVLPALLGLLGQMNPVTRDKPLVEEKLAELRRGMDGLEALLLGPWSAGPTLTLGDCALVPACFFLERFLPAFGKIRALGDHPKMAQVWDVARGDPTVAGLLAEMGDAMDDFLRRRAANG